MSTSMDITGQMEHMLVHTTELVLIALSLIIIQHGAIQIHILARKVTTEVINFLKKTFSNPVLLQGLLFSINTKFYATQPCPLSRVLT